MGARSSFAALFHMVRAGRVLDKPGRSGLDAAAQTRKGGHDDL
jgi:hypothetical protein